MSITISFGSDGGPVDWDAADLRKLEDAVDVLRRRYLEVDQPARRRYMRRAIGGLHPMLYGVAAPALPDEPGATPR